MSRQTPLHALHIAAGAKMADFAGWDLPIHYGSQLDEHHRVRRASGMFDVSHLLTIDVTGGGVKRFLRYLLAHDVERLTQAGKALYGCMLAPSGGVLDDLITYYFAPDRYRIVVNADTADKDVAWMLEQATGEYDVDITPRRDLGMIAVQGPQARAAVWEALPGAQAVSEALERFQAASFDDIMLCRTGYTGEDGFELIIPADRVVAVWQALAAVGVEPVGLGARDTLRLEAGMNLYGADMDETTTPFESGLAWTVDFTPGRDFIGRAALETAERASKLVGLLLEDRGVLRGHMTVRTAYGPGIITSGSFSPTLNAAIAFARVPTQVALGDRVEVEIRGTWHKARVTRRSFVREGKILV